MNGVPDVETRATIESLAREKAWLDFLAQATFSLHVWQLDHDLHPRCEHVLAWMRRCRDDLDRLVTR